MDVEDYNGDPAEFKYLEVQTNKPVGVMYNWMKDNTKITKDTQPPFTGYNSEKLLVSSPGKQYAGVYQFLMKTKAGTIAGRNITVDFTCKYCKVVSNHIAESEVFTTIHVK